MLLLLTAVVFVMGMINSYFTPERKSTPGVVINGKVVHAGGVPSREKIEQWLAA